MQKIIYLTLTFLLLNHTVFAETLKIGTAKEITAIDPHYHNYGPNNGINAHIFERLVHFNEKNLIPGLAMSWKNITPLLWEVRLRKGVLFHDGTPFTADDVIFSFHRAAHIKRSPSSFAPYLREIEKITKVSDDVIHFQTKSPLPLLPTYLSYVAILSEKTAKQAEIDDFNSGRSAIGTGPYRFQSWSPSHELVLEANKEYWGEKPKWNTVVIKPIQSDTSRLSSLLSGEVDIIDSVPPLSSKMLSNNKKFHLVTAPSTRLIYIHLDQFRDSSPYIKDYQGHSLSINPLKDIKVRQAISHAINRPLIIEKIMNNMAIEANQLVPSTLIGFSKEISFIQYDPHKSKSLLKESGYEHGFKITLHGPNDRYINDEKVIQAVAQMLQKIGIKTEVETLPKSIFFPQASKLKFSIILAGWASGTGDSSSPLKSLLHTYKKEQGFGFANRARYSNKKLDEYIQKSLNTIHSQKREHFMKKAAHIAMDDYALIPLYFQVNSWAMSKTLDYKPRRLSTIWVPSVKKRKKN